MTHLFFDAGTLLLEGILPDSLPEEARPWVRFDHRTQSFRARACDYAPLVLALRGRVAEFRDDAAAFAAIALDPKGFFTPRAHQKAAIDAWKEAGFRGVVSLPTGSGKTFVAALAINRLRRPALVLVPTIDLLHQWAGELEKFFACPVGMLGGGAHDLKDLTVSTYDSAVIHMERIGNRFGLLIADECHHLPGPMTHLAASMAIAPYRLGLTATPEQDFERVRMSNDLLGEVVFEVNIDELEGSVLAPYRTTLLEIELDADEAVRYQEHRAIYRDFIRRNLITFSNSADWGRFLALCAASDGGRKVFRSFLEQRRIARGGAAKQRKVWEIVQSHIGEQTIVFTADNATAYELGRKFLWPVITHRTHVHERKEFLQMFREKTYPVLVTSKVLNEGVDVPAASVGIVLSGSGSVREHVQRLGRILRPSAGKQAVLYELVSAGTGEQNTSERRRNHRAYRKRSWRR